MRSKIKPLLILILPICLAIGTLMLTASPSVHALSTENCDSSGLIPGLGAPVCSPTEQNTEGGDGSEGSAGATEEGGLLRNVEFNSKAKGELPTGTVDFGEPDEGAGKIYNTLIRYVNFGSIGVGVVAGFGVVIAGVQYAMSKGDPGKTSAAVKRITHVAIAIFLYIFGLVILNWLVPGGVLNDVSSAVSKVVEVAYDGSL